MNLAQHRLDLGEKIVRRVTAQVFDSGLVQAESVTQLFRRCAEGGVDVARGQAVQRERMDDPQRHRFVGGARESLSNSRLQHFAAFDDCLDVGYRTECPVLPESVPIAVVGDQTGHVVRYVLIQHLLHGCRQRPQDFTFLHGGNPLERIDVIRMHREQADVFVHSFVHAAVEPGERRQVFANPDLLLRRLLEEPFSHHELDVVPGDEHLLESVLHPADRVGDEREPGAVENGFLNAGHEAQAQRTA